MTQISNILEIAPTEDLSKYLGVPAVTGQVTRVMFQHIIDRVEKRLLGWKTKCLSLAGRATLIQSTISSILAYSMQTMRLPRSVCDNIDPKTRTFLGGTSIERRPHLVTWDTVTRPKEFGGLGLRDMRQLNSASMSKFGWRTLTESESLWTRVLRHKYCKGRCDMNMFNAKSDASSTWKGISENAHVI